MKTVRQQRILELIQMHDIEKQEELVQMLCEDGFDVTQATVSRDISQLRLKKVSGKNGKLVYKAAESKHQQAEPKYLRILKESYVSMDMAMNILVIKTVSGMAMAAAAALDACHFSEIVGCIAGDDTIMCAAKTADMALGAAEKLRSFVRLNK